MSNVDTETVADPTLTAGEDPALEGAPQTTDPVEQEPAGDPEPSPQPAARTVPLDTFTREVGALRHKNRETEAALEEHRRLLREANELLARQSRGGEQDPQTPAHQPQHRAPDPQDIEAEINRRAQIIAVQNNFQSDAQRVSETGARTFGADWQSSINNLSNWGVNSADFVGTVMEVAGRERTHEVMHEIGQDPHLAATLRDMPPLRRAAEISKIADRMSNKTAETQQATPRQPAPRTVSRAPAPAPRVEPSATQRIDPRSDKASDEEFDDHFFNKFMRRGEARMRR
jgi:hypothetical protein